MKHTAGIFLIDSNSNVLICEPFGGSEKHNGYSVPKGLRDDGETYLETAIRETKEECGFDVTPYIDNIKDIGEQKYKKRDKIFHGFLLQLDFEINPTTLVCNSFIGNNPKTPEIINFEMVSIDDALTKLHIVQQKILDKNRNKIRKTS